MLKLTFKMHDLAVGLATAIGKDTSTHMKGLREADPEYFNDPTVSGFLDSLGVADYAKHHCPP